MQQPLLFFGLATGEVQAVLAAARKRAFHRGDIVYHQGDPGDSMQLIVRGHFALWITTPQGNVHVFRVYGPGDVFGRLAVASIEAVRDMTVVCIDGGETFELFRKQLDQLRAEHPSVSDALVAMASSCAGEPSSCWRPCIWTRTGGSAPVARARGAVPR